jgi:ferrochelatase
LLVHTRDLATGLQGELGEAFRVAYAMRYQSPPIAGALDELAGAGCRRIVVVPLFPQYASAAYGSALARTLELAAQRWNVPAMAALPPFYDDPGFVSASAEVARGAITHFGADHILFSYHGLPEQQIRKSDQSGEWCLGSPSCCDDMGARNSFCYRAQCYATTRAIAGAMDLEGGTYSTSFQSRLAGQKWIEPYTDQVLAGLRDQGVRRLAVMTPSFVADCLETLEEIGIRLRRQWDREPGVDRGPGRHGQGRRLVRGVAGPRPSSHLDATGRYLGVDEVHELSLRRGGQRGRHRVAGGAGVRPLPSGTPRAGTEPGVGSQLPRR